MASEAEIAEVRSNIAEPDDVEPYTDTVLTGLIDTLGVTSASLAIWRRKAASYAGLVNVTEAGASHSFSDLFTHAQAMIKQFESIVSNDVTKAPRVTAIVRTT